MRDPEKKDVTRRLRAVAGAAALLACALPRLAGASPDGQDTARQSAPPAPAAPAKAESPAKQLPAALVQALRRDPESPVTAQWADGTVAADLGGSYLNVWIARVNPDGSVSHSCVTSTEQATAALSGPPALEMK